MSPLRRAAVVVCALAACDGNAGTVVPTVDAGTSSSSSLVDPSVLERGEYLVRSVAGCGECHTPRDAQGNLDQSQWLGGVPNRFDLVPDDDTMGGAGASSGTGSGWRAGITLGMAGTARRYVTMAVASAAVMLWYA